MMQGTKEMHEQEWHDVIQDKDLLQDVLVDVEEKHQEIEDAINSLNQEPDSIVLLNGIFRSLHTIKGDAKFCQIKPIVDFIHIVETLVGRLRDSEISYFADVGEIILLCLDRALVMSQDAFSKGRINITGFDEILVALERFATSSQANLANAGKIVIDVLSGTFGQTNVEETDNRQKQAHETGIEETKYSDDLVFFRSLVHEMEARAEFWAKRSESIMAIATEMNNIADNPVNNLQLQAAVYLHDIGMALFPDKLLQKEGKYDQTEQFLLNRHPAYGAGLTQRMNGWQQCSQIILQHHEHIDGSGYPDGIKDEAICDGAKIMAICDAFFSMTHSRSYGTTKRSLLRAVSEINTCSGYQFCPKWVAVFNTTIKMQTKDGASFKK